MKYKSFNSMLDDVKNKGPVKVAAAGPAKKEVLEGLRLAQAEGIIEPILIGDSGWIFQRAREAGLDLSKAEIVNEPRLELPAANIAVDIINNNRADFIINGYVRTQHILQAVSRPERGLRTDRALSMLTAIESPKFSHLIFIADTAFHGSPNSEIKLDILDNAISYLTVLKVEKIKVVLLSGNNVADEPSTLKAQEIFANLSQKYPGLIVEDSLSLESGFNADPDIFLTPNADSGNILSESLVHLTNGSMASIVLGAQVPIVLVTPNSTSQNLFNSLIMAVRFRQAKNTF
ncbi:MAG: phosphate acyltransferase [Desulfitobacterium hafniense]|nr:phosphate acyltransferase [Desulfitobacterium hafniense]